MQPSAKNQNSRLTAVLGPTNTGKTFLAVERMCAHSSGVMGFPLRLLAREVFDRVRGLKGDGQVALITGEERIEPPGARWYFCTAESMPQTFGPDKRDFAFVALDEAQLGMDGERGHIFTDRMLSRRGREETMILGSSALSALVGDLLPDAAITTRPRFSTLSYAAPKKLSRLPPRSAIVAFSVEEVYAVAEMLRRQKGGAAVVMGALSPATRNKQVEMFQAGEVDYLVATDAIGMGLNLDVSHIAFASLRKFDGKRRRRLLVPEMAQIAGRAGRHQRDGTFSTLLADKLSFTPEEIEAIEAHRMPAIEGLYWRNSEPRTNRLENLIADLEQRPSHQRLMAAPEALDLSVLKLLSSDPSIRVRLPSRDVSRLWAAASLPDFLKSGVEHHARFIGRLWQFLGSGNGLIPRRYFAEQLARLENVQGDVDTLAARISAVRTWAYAAHRPDWVEEREEMAERARGIESRLSDSLHDRLRQRFVDKKSKILYRKMGQSNFLPELTLDEAGQVLIDGDVIGSLNGFRFKPEPGARGQERRMLLAAAEKYLGELMSDLVTSLVEASDDVFEVKPDDKGLPIIFFGESRVGRLVKGSAMLAPQIKLDSDDSPLSDEAKKSVEARVSAWLAAQLEKWLGSILAMEKASTEETTPAPLRGLIVQLIAAGAIAKREDIFGALKGMDKEIRAVARKLGINFGALEIYHYQAVKPMACFWRDVLFGLWNDNPMQTMPDFSAVHLDDWSFRNEQAAALAGYRSAGNEWLRVDLAERLIRRAHDKRGNDEIFPVDLTYATSLGLSEAGLIGLLTQAGFSAANAPDEAMEEEAKRKAALEAAEAAKERARYQEQKSREYAERAAAQGDAAAEEYLEANPAIQASETAVVSEAEAAPAAEPMLETTVEDEGELTVDKTGEPVKIIGKSYYYAGPQVWFTWAPGNRGRVQGQAAKPRRQAPRREKFKQRNDNDYRSPRLANDGGRGTKPAKSALAEALGAQLAALKDKK